ncbi:MAG: hypothetical protein A2V73_08120 [candidate division Zixibacteria bacterium RBG_19FT_COMBO_42_43]|nr:MAG: hypothetical protein A2V73_08120 [candidate division Zixibacteria bacterium RBG_19FT_COMBO_42_43]
MAVNLPQNLLQVNKKEEEKMKPIWIVSLAAIVLFSFAPQIGRADVNVGLSIQDGEVRSFYLAVGDYYGVPERSLIVVRERHIPDDEVPVVFFLAREARVGPDVIVNLRLSGKSWMDITLHYGLSPQIFYVPLAVDPGPPYGKAWGYYKKHPRNKWREIRLADADVVNFVNLKFISNHYGYSPDQVVKMRSGGKKFVAIHGEIKKGKEKSKAKAESTGKSGKKESKGKSKGKGKY